MTVTASWTPPTAGGTLDLSAGAVVTETVWDALVSNQLYLGGATGAFTNFTPTLTQGAALTLTGVNGRYWQIGKLVIVLISFGINSAGTAGQSMTIGALPVSINSAQVWGAGLYLDAGTQFYVVSPVKATATTVTMSAQGGGGNFGASQAVTAAAGDSLTILLAYEAA